MASGSDFLGRGWSFPPEFVKPGNPAMPPGAVMAEGVADIEQSIRIILSTVPGERTMALEFGCPLPQYLFQAVDRSTETMVIDRVKYALLHFEPRIVVETVSVDGSGAGQGQMTVSIDYTVRATNSRHNAVYPHAALEGTLLAPP